MKIPLPTLAGSVHSDERGFERALHFLNSFQPDLVFVELSPYAKVFRDRHQHTLQRTMNLNLKTAAKNCGLTLREALRHPEIRALRRQLTLPFEYRAARRFSEATGSMLSLVDYSPFSRELIWLWPELLSPGNLALLLTLPRDNRLSPSRIYELAARAIRRADPWTADLAASRNPDTSPFWEKRERFMADRIRSVLKRRVPRKAVYLGGWQHLTVGGSFPSLRELLGLEHTPGYLLDRGFL
jgi:hypothetical protein